MIIKDIEQNDKGNLIYETFYPYIYFDIFFLDNNTIHAFWNGKSIISDNDENSPAIGFIKNEPYVIKGPIKYKYLKDIYDYLGGNEWKKNTITDEEDVYFTIGNSLKNRLEKIYKDKSE
jgi:hypothetical protein